MDLFIRGFGTSQRYSHSIALSYSLSSGLTQAISSGVKDCEASAAPPDSATITAAGDVLEIGKGKGNCSKGCQIHSQAA